MKISEGGNAQVFKKASNTAQINEVYTSGHQPARTPAPVATTPAVQPYHRDDFGPARKPAPIVLNPFMPQAASTQGKRHSQAHRNHHGHPTAQAATTAPAHAHPKKTKPHTKPAQHPAPARPQSIRDQLANAKRGDGTVDGTEMAKIIANAKKYGLAPWEEAALRKALKDPAVSSEAKAEIRKALKDNNGGAVVGGGVTFEAG